MKFRFYILFCIIILLNSITDGFSFQKEIIVKLNPEAASKGKASAFSYLTKRKGVISVKSVFPDFSTRNKTGNINEDFFNSFYVLTLHDSAFIKECLNELNNLSSVGYAVPNNVYALSQTQEDPLFGFQWGLKQVGIEGAWGETEGNKKIIIGLIDSGVEYFHDDLKGNIWINQAEDIDGDGLFTDADCDGKDNDGNGYIDDVAGWDFTDAPSFPDWGDYFGEDNRPDDEAGHGTSMAGIIGAVRNNGTGIAGIVPQTSIMNLRAATARGLLEEDDVARAIVYSVHNGAKVINLSFGDVVYSRFLEDITEYAYQKGCVLVGSAGNSSSSQIHYPSGFGHVLSVGSSDRTDTRTDFTNYGTTVDIYAPGVEIYTTLKNNSYGQVSGTSASAAIVSGAAALILSKFENLDNKEVTNIIITNSDPFPAGVNETQEKRLNVEKCLKQIMPLTAELNIKKNLDTLIFFGTASGWSFLNYSISYTIDNENGSNWNAVIPENPSQRVNGRLGQTIITNWDDTTYFFKLTVRGLAEIETQDIAVYNLDRTPPKIVSIDYSTILDRNEDKFFIEVVTDEPCWIMVNYKDLSSLDNDGKKDAFYYDVYHRIIITKSEAGGDILDFSVTVENGAGLKTTSSRYNYEMETQCKPSWTMDLRDTGLSAGYMLPVLTDFDNDGQKEILFTSLKQGYIYDALEIFEWSESGFRRVFMPRITGIPRDVADIDRNGILDLLITKGNKAYIYESREADGFPEQLKAEIPIGYTGLGFFDFDNDSIPEIIGLAGNTVSIGKYENNKIVILDSLRNDTEGGNYYGTFQVAVDDVDGDGNYEILFGDKDGDLLMYEYRSGAFYREWNTRLLQGYEVNYISVGDFDGDGTREFIAGGYSVRVESYLENAEMGMWYFRMFENTAPGVYKKMWETRILGKAPADIFFNSSAVINLDTSHQDEIVLSIYPDLYIFTYNEIYGDFYCEYYLNGSRTGRIMSGDLNGNNIYELYINLNGTIHSVEKETASKPPPPYNLRAVPLDTARIKLTWEYSDESASFIIYKGKGQKELYPYAQTEHLVYIDSMVQMNQQYRYGVSSVNTGFEEMTSAMTEPVSVKAHRPVSVTSVCFIPPKQIEVYFDRTLSKDAENKRCYNISPYNPGISSALLVEQGKTTLLTLQKSFSEEGIYRLECNGITDSSGMKIDRIKNYGEFYVETVPEDFYIENAAILNSNTIEIRFSVPVDSVSAKDVNNYTIIPAIAVKSVSLDINRVILTLDPSRPLGAFGVEYTVIAEKIKSIYGMEITKGNSYTIRISPAELTDVFVFPNPCTLESGYITFANITQNSEIKIMSTSGRAIMTLYETDGNGGIQWDLKDHHGKDLSTGVYLYVVRNGKSTYKGKFVVLR